MIGVLQINLLILVLILIVVFGIMSHVTFKMDDMEIKNIGFKILKGITYTVTVAIGLVLVVLVRHNADAVMDILQM